QSQDCGRMAVQPSADIVSLRAKPHAGDIIEANHRTIGIFANDNLAEFLFRNQPALGGHRIGELLAMRRGWAADLPGGIDSILSRGGSGEIADGDIEFRELIGPYPKPHRIL